MPKSPATFARIFAFSARLIRWGAIGFAAVSFLQAAIYYGNLQHLKRAYAAMHPVQALPRTPNGLSPNIVDVTPIVIGDAGSGLMQGDAAIGIDAAGDVAGVYIDSANVRYGFIRYANGTFSPPISMPGAGKNYVCPNGCTSTNLKQGTVPVSINAQGDIAGYFSDAKNVTHGFVRYANGAYSPPIDGRVVDPNGDANEDVTVATGINTAGVVMGYFRDNNGLSHGFILPPGGPLQPVDDPDATTSYLSFGVGDLGGTKLFGINADGVTIGTYITSIFTTNQYGSPVPTSFTRHGFVRSAGGQFTQIDGPKATGTTSVEGEHSASGTIPLGMNSEGDIVGVYSDAGNMSHGFIRSAAGALTPFVFPDAGDGGSVYAAFFNGSGAASINDSGQVTGVYTGTDGLFHGFIRDVDGTMTPFNVGGVSGGYQGAAGASINASGTVAGTYLDNTGVVHAFVYKPVTKLSIVPGSPAITPDQDLAVTVTVSGGKFTPSGTVVLTSGTFTSDPLSLDINGQVIFTIPGGNLPLQTDPVLLIAAYTPDTSSPSNTMTTAWNTVMVVTPGGGGGGGIVTPAKTTLTLSANPSSSTYGQQITLTAVLAPMVSSNLKPNGELITFYNGTTSLGTGIISNSTASLTLSSLPLGVNSLKAVYVGDANYETSTSSALSFTVAPVAPTIAFSVPGHTYGDAAFTVKATSNSPGTLTYSVISGPATIAGSTVALTGVGTVTLQASQAASGNYAAGAQTASFAVSMGAQTISFTAPASPVNYGVAPITLAATASSGLAVKFSVLSGPASVSSNVLTITGAGTVVVAADQAGNTLYSAAGEVTRSITVNKIAAVIILTTSPNPVLAQNPVALTATISSSVSTPTGPVVFSEGATTLGTANLSSGVASANVSTLAVGTHVITAAYAGDNNFNALNSSTVGEIVQDFSITGGTGSTSQTVKAGGTATYTFPVTLPTGTTLPAPVTFSATGLPPGATATFNPASLPAGSGSTMVTLSIQVPQTAALEIPDRPGSSMPLIALTAMLLPFVGSKAKSGRGIGKITLLLAALIGVGAASLTGCRGDSQAKSGSPIAGTYTITATATAGSLSHATTVMLIVQ